MTDDEIMARLQPLSAACLSDVQFRQNCFGSAIKPVFPPAERMVGRAYTVRTGPGHHTAVVKGMIEAQPGQVLVIEEAGYGEGATVGELVAFYSKNKGLRGIVIDGAARDVADMRRIGLPVFARSITPRGGEGDTLGEWDLPIVMNNVLVRPGDWIIGDEDGVTLVPGDIAEQVIERGEALQAKENRVIKQGEDLLDVYGLRESLTSKSQAVAAKRYHR
jgi:regulator of RNase E activity RraA